MRRTSILLVAGALIVAACSTSDDSVLVAGNDATTTTAAAATTAPPEPGQTTVPSATAPPTQAPTTVPRPLDSLPPCDVDALDAAAASGPVSINFWHGMSNELGRELERLTEAYNASQTKVKVNLEFQGGYEQTIDKYLQSNTDNRPDLVQMPEYAVQVMVDAEGSIPVQACVEDAGFALDHILPAALDAYELQSVQWSMPFNLSNPVLYWNKKVFLDAGLDPDVGPVTLAEVSEFGRKIRDSGAASYGIAFDSAPDSGGGWYLEQWLSKEGLPYSDNDNGRTAPSTRVLFDAPEVVALLTELQDVVTNGAGVYVGENTSSRDHLLKLADAQSPATMTIGTSAALGPLLGFVAGGIIPDITVDDIGVGPMPSPNGAPGVLIGGASLWITADHGDEKAAAAWDFITYLLGAQVQSEWAAATGYVPINAKALDLDPIKTLFTTDPRFKVAYDQVVATPDLPTAHGPVLGPQREIRVTAAAAMGKVFNGADPAAALAEAAGIANALLTDYNSRRG